MLAKNLQVVRAVLAVLLQVMLIPSLAMAQNWIQLNAAGQVPLPYAGTPGGAAYDATSNRLMIFGGGQPNVSSFWVLSGANGHGNAVWTQLVRAGTLPTPRQAHSLVYDAGSNRAIIFGGCANGNVACTPSQLLNDVWVLSDANGLAATAPAWTQLSPSGIPPAPRAGHTAVFDSASNRMIVFGGCTAGTLGCDIAQNDTWVLINATGLGGQPVWQQLSTTGALPGSRDGHAAAYDPDTNRMIVFGGIAGSAGTQYSDVWVLESANGLAPSQWVQLTPAGSATPGPRFNHTVIYNAAANQLVTFGGASGGTPTSNDVWALSQANGRGGTPMWTLVLPTGGPPSARADMVSAFDSANNRMMIFGGNTGPAPGSGLNDSWVLMKP